MSPESHAGAYFAAPEVYDLMYADMRFDIEPLIREAKTANGPVLEPCCGNGRITLPMAAAGVDCDGFDLDPGMVADLQRQAAERTLTIGAHVADMRDFTMPRRYGLIVIGFNSFLHNLTQEDQLRTLERCREHLLPGGRLHLVVFHPSARRLAAFDGTLVLVKEIPHAGGSGTVRVFDAITPDTVEQVNHVKRRVEIVDATGAVVATHDHEFDVRYVYKHEMALLLRTAGYRRFEVRPAARANDPTPVDPHRSLVDGDMLAWTAWAE
jgi:SAM-dependent methyltransferase